MPDDSKLDALYFIDRYRYNCPYCNRRHVTYAITWTHFFDWTYNKRCLVIFVKCESCGKESMHLTYGDIVSTYNSFNAKDIDSQIFYSVPSSFHVIDERIPAKLRELLDEAQGCLKSNFLTGASACVRKIVYELARLNQAEGAKYDERIRNLKKQLPNVEPEYFDTLLNIQQLTSDKVHEDSYDGWESRHLKILIAALVEALHEIYVMPKERERRRQEVLDLRNKVLEARNSKQETSESTNQQTDNPSEN